MIGLFDFCAIYRPMKCLICVDFHFLNKHGDLVSNKKKEIENYFDILSQTERCNKLNNWREKNSQKQQTNNLIIVTRVSESMIEKTDISFRSIIQSK